jgi:6-phosphogluconate dehydrogenase
VSAPATFTHTSDLPSGRIRGAYARNRSLKNLLVDPDFAAELNGKQASWRRIVSLCVASGIAAPAFATSLG